MIVDGVSWLLDVKAGGGGVGGVEQREDEGLCGAGKLPSLVAAAPAGVRVASKHTATRGLGVKGQRTKVKVQYFFPVPEPSFSA